jgi:hypothetical protein
MSDEPEPQPIPEHMLKMPEPISDLRAQRNLLSRLSIPAVETWTDEEVLALKDRIDLALRLTEERNAAVEQLFRALMELRHPRPAAPLPPPGTP